MAWYSIDMPEDSVVDGVYHRFCRRFQKAFISAGAPPELALFACRNRTSTGRRLYLTPSSPGYLPDLIQSYGAEPCDVPQAGAVTLVYGVPGAKSMLSPSEDVSVISDRGDVGTMSTTHPDSPKRRDLSLVYPLRGARRAATSG